MTDASATPQDYPGQRLGLPEDGPGSIAGWGARILAIFIDWFAALAITALVASLVTIDEGLEPALTSVIFLLQLTVATAFFNASFGQLAARVAVVRVDGQPLSLGRSFLRSALILLVIPPLVFNRDYRGLHDLAAGTVALSRR